MYWNNTKDTSCRFSFPDRYKSKKAFRPERRAIPVRNYNDSCLHFGYTLVWDAKSCFKDAVNVVPFIYHNLIFAESNLNYDNNHRNLANTTLQSFYYSDKYRKLIDNIGVLDCSFVNNIGFSLNGFFPDGDTHHHAYSYCIVGDVRHQADEAKLFAAPDKEPESEVPFEDLEVQHVHYFAMKKRDGIAAQRKHLSYVKLTFIKLETVKRTVEIVAHS